MTEGTEIVSKSAKAVEGTNETSSQNTLPAGKTNTAIPNVPRRTFQTALAWVLCHRRETAAIAVLTMMTAVAVDQNSGPSQSVRSTSVESESLDELMDAFSGVEDPQPTSLQSASPYSETNGSSAESAQSEFAVDNQTATAPNGALTIPDMAGDAESGVNSGAADYFGVGIGVNAAEQSTASPIRTANLSESATANQRRSLLQHQEPAGSTKQVRFRGNIVPAQ